MKLLTQELIKTFPILYATEGKYPKDIKVITKFFDPCSSRTWYAIEYDPENKVFFGLIMGMETELGYFSLDELETFKGRIGLGIERDIQFGEHTLAEVMEKLIQELVWLWMEK